MREKEIKMKSNLIHSKKRVIIWFRMSIFVNRWFIMLVVLASCTGCIPDTSPPDLSDCTRFEIEWTRGILNYIALDSFIQRSIFSQDDKEYIQSFDTYVVTDSERIKAFANDVDQGNYCKRLRGEPACSVKVHITCYHNNKRLTSFTVYGDCIVAQDRGMFRYPSGLPNLKIIEPPEIQPYKLRFGCAFFMELLYAVGPLRRSKVEAYPSPDTWCDVVVRACKKKGSDGMIKRVFRCPSALTLADQEESHVQSDEIQDKSALSLESNYAINPNCKPYSPDDMVLLFETKAGWNQHGGPELFTFDNHDPKGGCVLLNDGTVKFIRTKEELNALRWK